MQFKKRQGETVAQIARRAELKIQEYGRLTSEAYRVRDLAISKSDNINPRTKRLYRDEAQLLFTTVALIEEAIRTNQAEHVLTFTREALEIMGFDLVSLYENKHLKDGAYDEKK